MQENARKGRRGLAPPTSAPIEKQFETRKDNPIKHCCCRCHLIGSVRFLCFLLSFLFLQFPVCDGSHNEWNKKTGDNIGPFVATLN